MKKIGRTQGGRNFAALPRDEIGTAPGHRAEHWCRTR
jgi:hypothetical protein